MIKRNREIEIFSLSFLDIISCAFGAIILILLVIKKGDSIPEQNLDINRVEENIIEKLKVSENIEKLKADFNFLTEISAKRFVRAYGLNAWILLEGASKLEDLGQQFGEILTQREVEYLRKNEFAMEADDIIWRRTKLGLRMSEQDKRRLSEYLKTS